MSRERMFIQIAAGILIFLIIGSGIGYFWFDHHAAKIHGPYAMCGNDDHLWIATSRELIRTDRQGSEPTILETTLPISNISDLALHPDGRLLLADYELGTLWAMAADGGMAVPFLDREYRGTLKIAVTDEHIFVAIRERNRIDRFDLYGRLEEKGPIRHLEPNDIWVHQNGDLWVADSYRNRLVSVSADDLGEVKEEIWITDELAWPIAVQGTSNDKLWAIVTDYWLENGRLLEIDLQTGSKIGRELADKAPEALMIHEDRVLVADMEAFSLDLFPGTPFGDEAFQDILSDTANEHRWYRRMVTVSKLMLGLAIVFAFFIFQHNQSLKGPRPLDTGREPVFGPEGFSIHTLYIQGVVCILLAFANSFVFPQQGIVNQVVYVAVPISFALPLFWLGIVLRRTRIGVEDARIVLIDHRGRRVDVDPGRVLHSRWAMEADGIVVVTRMLTPVFSQDRLDAEIAPLLFEDCAIGFLQTLTLLKEAAHPFFYVIMALFLMMIVLPLTAMALMISAILF